MSKELDIVKAIKDRNLLGSYFPNGLESWSNWLVFFKVLSGYTKSKFTKRELRLFRECTGLKELPKERLRECFLVCGRRGAKSTTAGLLAVFYGLWGGWERYLNRGEKAYIFIVSPNMSQGKIIKDYILGIFDSNPVLKKKVKKVLAAEIHLNNNVIISIKPASWRSSRGFSVGLLLMEELAFYRWDEESANRDKEIYTALTPGLTTIKNSLTLGLSTPFAKAGLLWEKYKKHWGKPGPVLIWKAPSWKMNLTLTEKELRERYSDLGEAEFSAEFGANFREDIEGFLPAEIYDKAVAKGRDQVPPKEGVEYVGFADFSEGLRKGADSSTLAIVHEADNKIILDYLLEVRAPFNPDDVLQRVIAACKSWRVSKITQDRHSIAWISKDLEREGIQVEVSEKNKSEIYELFSVEMNRGNVELLDIPRLRSQCLGLHRFLRSGGSKIDHLPQGHDDTINAVAGAVVVLTSSKGKKGYFFWA